ncbi:MAG: glycosyltransferase [Gemmataceae bacterium]|nr:glycosyltransferase [Gemmataceae bacterium]
MMPVVEALLWVCVAVVLLPMVVLVVECLAALLPRRRPAFDPTAARPRCAVLIPAHDEEAGIGRTLAGLGPQLTAGDRLVVVADNCTDRTADIARTHGAIVHERTHATDRGKGFALDHGVRRLEADPPDVVVIVDADCVVRAGALDLLVREAARGRPVQAAYVMAEPPRPTYKQRLSAVAFQFKNVVRPLGLDRLGGPCLLTGTGMAFPWPVLRDAGLASGNIVEDMALGIDLAVAGYPPRLCSQAIVTSELPASEAAAVAQRRRWEHGHLQTLLTQVPRLLRAALCRARPRLLGLALELSVPPLSLLFLLWALVFAASVGFWFAGGPPHPAVVLACGALAVVLAVLAAWAKFGRDRLPLTSLLAAPFYVLWKVPIYVAFLFRRRRQAKWNRTARDASAGSGSGHGQETGRTPDQAGAAHQPSTPEPS